MFSIKLHISELEDHKFIQDKQENYSYAFHKAFSCNSLNKKDLENFIKEKFGLNDIEVRSLISEVQMKHAQIKTNNENKQAKIKEIKHEIDRLYNRLLRTKKENKSLFDLKRKLVGIEDSAKRGITFGSKNLLKKISYLSNYKGQILNVNGKEIDVDKELLKLKDEYKQNRVLPIYLIGEANQKGNRFFEFDFENNEIIYKYSRQKH